MSTLFIQHQYILLGYSIGGNLAFEVAKKLIEKGYKVANIIMIDSYKKDQKIAELEEDVNKYVEEKIKKLDKEEIFKYNDDLLIEKNISNKIRSYYKYSRNIINEGKVSTDIELLVSEENMNFVEKINK